MFEVEAQSHSSPRTYRTMIINKLFNKGADGKYAQNFKDGFFEEARTMYEKKFGKDTNKALPKSILVGLYFQGNESAFQSALMAGDIEEIDDNGKTFYSFKELKTGTERAATKSTNISSGPQKSTMKELTGMAELVDSLGWSFNVTPKDKKALMCLSNGTLPPAVITSLGQAKSACEKLEKQGMSILSKLAVESDHKVKL